MTKNIIVSAIGIGVATTMLAAGQAYVVHGAPGSAEYALSEQLNILRLDRDQAQRAQQKREDQILALQQQVTTLTRMCAVLFKQVDQTKVTMAKELNKLDPVFPLYPPTSDQDLAKIYEWCSADR